MHSLWGGLWKHQHGGGGRRAACADGRPRGRRALTTGWPHASEGAWVHLSTRNTRQKEPLPTNTALASCCSTAAAGSDG